MDDILLGLQIKYDGDGMAIYDSIASKEKPDVEEVVKAIKTFNKYNKGYKVITMISDDYPEFLKKGYKPPFMVFEKGKKLYYKYGKNLTKNYEIKDGEESKYHNFLTKICK